MIRIHVRRNIPEDKKEDVMLWIIKLRSMSMGKPGYISGETLKNLDDPSDYLVISTWQSLDDWRQWVVSRERIEVQNEIDARLDEDTVYEIYQYG